jgi:hypothetical protein
MIGGSSWAPGRKSNHIDFIEDKEFEICRKNKLTPSSLYLNFHISRGRSNLNIAAFTARTNTPIDRWIDSHKQFKCGFPYILFFFIFFLAIKSIYWDFKDRIQRNRFIWMLYLIFKLYIYKKHITLIKMLASQSLDCLTSYLKG